MNSKDILSMILGSIMLTGLGLGIGFLFLFILCPSYELFSLSLVGWIGYFIFGWLHKKNEQ